MLKMWTLDSHGFKNGSDIHHAYGQMVLGVVLYWGLFDLAVMALGSQYI